MGSVPAALYVVGLEEGLKVRDGKHWELAGCTGRSLREGIGKPRFRSCRVLCTCLKCPPVFSPWREQPGLGTRTDLPRQKGVLCLAPAQPVTARGEGGEGVAPGLSLHL